MAEVFISWASPDKACRRLGPLANNGSAVPRLHSRADAEELRITGFSFRRLLERVFQSLQSPSTQGRRVQTGDVRC